MVKDIALKYTSKNLVIRILIGFILGAGLGILSQNLESNFINNFIKFSEILGSLFVGALKAIAPILVFVLIISSIVSKKLGDAKGFKFVLILYLVGTFLASCVGVGFSFIFPVQIALNDIVSQNTPQNIAEVFKNLAFKMVDNPISAISSGNFIGILVWSVGLGLALRFSNETTKTMIKDFADGLTKIVKVIIELAPFGIFGIVAISVSTLGVSAIASYVKITILLICAMLFVALIVNPLIVFLCLKKNPFPLIFVCLKNSGLTAFFTRSSAANIPVNLELCKKMKLDEKLYSISIPIGANINMAGAAITIAVLTLGAAFTLDIAPDFGSALLLCLIAAVGACGASGVAGGSLMLIPLACSLFNIPNDTAMQVIAIGFTIGVIQDSLETAINSSTDVIFTAVASYKSNDNYEKEILEKI